MPEPRLDSIERAVADIAAGRAVVVVDHDDGPAGAQVDDRLLDRVQT